MCYELSQRWKRKARPTSYLPQKERRMLRGSMHMSPSRPTGMRQRRLHVQQRVLLELRERQARASGALSRHRRISRKMPKNTLPLLRHRRSSLRYKQRNLQEHLPAAMCQSQKSGRRSTAYRLGLFRSLSLWELHVPTQCRTCMRQRRSHLQHSLQLSMRKQKAIFIGLPCG